MISIHNRLQVSALLVLIAFLGLAAAAIDQSFRYSLLESTRDRLMGQVYALLAAAEEDRDGRVILPVALPDPRLGRPGSGLYAQVVSEQADYQWESSSMLGIQVDFPQVQEAGLVKFESPQSSSDRFYSLSLRIIWTDAQERELSYRFSVAEVATIVAGQITDFRQTLLFWLGIVSLLLLLTQGIILRWGLRPLRDVARDLELIEQGERERLTGQYPRELSGLTQRINTLIGSSIARQKRYRNSLGDLAHSLKTPLAVLQGAADQADTELLKSAVNEQIPRMSEIVQYQLNKAAASGVNPNNSGVPAARLVERLVATLDKVYIDKGIQTRVDIEPELMIPGDEGDLLEILGNLLDNAYKYGRSRVLVEAKSGVGSDAIRIRIEDDGRGIPAQMRERVLQRGRRADEREAGQGIGLSVAYETLLAYKGSLAIKVGSMGGVLLEITMPTT